MKKLFVLVFVMTTISTMAQVQYKPEKGNFSTELQFRPFSFLINDFGEEIGTSPFSIDGLRLRYFFNEKIALRANLNWDYQMEKNVDNNVDEMDYNYYPYGHITGSTSLRQSMYTIGIAPGFEYHFGKSERLSVYAGVDLIFGITKYKYKEKEDLTLIIPNNNTSVRTEFEMSSNNAWATFYPNRMNTVGIDQRSHYTFGATIFMGADFYVYKGLYLGAELGISYNYFAFMKAKVNGKRIVTTDAPYGTSSDIFFVDRKLTDKEAFSAVNFMCQPALRLGWKF
ncbi:MAG: outer membrane beta-barrel protein [Bacteroidales bacterium]|jgi:hypothetical protein|nr:outer membrane beta-barrel protein [Bacteroidales bacterium]